MRQTCRRTPDHEGEGGFTLAEMLLVLAIMALVSGLVVAHGLPGRGAARSAALVGFLREARAAAMSAGRAHHLSADALGTGNALRDDQGAKLVLGPGYGIDLRAAAAGLWFQPDGSSGGGTVIVWAPGGESYGAQVQPVTGTVIAFAP